MDLPTDGGEGHRSCTGWASSGLFCRAAAAVAAAWLCVAARAGRQRVAAAPPAATPTALPPSSLSAASGMADRLRWWPPCRLPPPSEPSDARLASVAASSAWWGGGMRWLAAAVAAVGGDAAGWRLGAAGCQLTRAGHCCGAGGAAGARVPSRQGCSRAGRALAAAAIPKASDAENSQRQREGCPASKRRRMRSPVGMGRLTTRRPRRCRSSNLTTICSVLRSERGAAQAHPHAAAVSGLPQLRCPAQLCTRQRAVFQARA